MFSTRSAWALFSSCLLLSCLERPIHSEQPIGVREADVQRVFGGPWFAGTDVLLVIDDSLSMSDKQAVLRLSLAYSSLTPTRCTALDGSVSAPKNGQCPPGLSQSLLFGSPKIIRSSVGAGGIACGGQEDGAVPLPLLSEQEVLDSGGPSAQWYAQLGQLKNDGCAFEGPLEAMYRFLIDPEPPLHITTRGEGGATVTVAEGVDQTVLDERERFLKPVSELVIIFLSDEDDCSVGDAGSAWKIGAPPGLARASFACEASPEGPCCRSCDTKEDQPPQGCDALKNDPVCSNTPTWSEEEDLANLRCFNTKERFGEDWLFPIERYTRALTQPVIATRSGEMVPNPLFRYGRTPEMIWV